MRRWVILLATVALVALLVLAGALVVSAMGPGGWRRGMMGGNARPGGGFACPYPGSADEGRLPFWRGQDSGPAPDASAVASLEQAEEAFERYVESRGYEDTVVTEVMEFEQNYYAIVAERAKDMGAMELILDKVSGDVWPEPGPNMMWNAKYGMHGSMMGRWRASGEMTVTPEEAQVLAQQWLDRRLPGRTAGTGDPFYGYYTLHFLRDGQVDGMLSVNGATGQVWYHSWHGDFIQMTEHDD